MPMRDLFIYRVERTTDISDIRQHIVDNGFTIIDLQCMSNQNAKFKSFKLSVPISEFSDLFNPSIWPQGVNVRRFSPPRREFGS